MSSNTAMSQTKRGALKGPRVEPSQTAASLRVDRSARQIVREPVVLQPQLDTNTDERSNRPAVPKTCDKLLAMFSKNRDNPNSIQRVNFIKKSGSQASDYPLTSSRRLMRNKVTIDNRSDKLTDDKPVEQAPSDTTEDTIQPDDAKRSHKLVVSLIKGMGKTASNEELDEMLKEIHSAIDEIRQQNSCPESKQDAKQSKKKELTQVIGVERLTDGEIVCKAAHRHDKCKDENSGHPDGTKGETLVKVEVNSSNTKPHQNLGDIRKHLMDLSSDEETNKGSDRKSTCDRLPDRCLRITSSHAKYISPHRKRSLEDRLNRAQEAREKFLEYRANKFRDILKKVEEMRAWKEEDTMNLKASVQTKLQKAAAKRQEQLDKIIRKAHDEDSKVSEIQFINNLEAQNRRHDLNSRKKEFEARLQDLQDERQKRFEEKQAKEVAAEERRKNLEAERKAKLIQIQQRRRMKDQKVEQQQRVKEKRRIEKNQFRDQKISAIKEAYNAGVQTLKKRIDQKQEQSERRHEVNLKLIRQKAFELSIKRYNSFVNAQSQPKDSCTNASTRHKELSTSENQRLQLKPFNTKKFCNLCKETIGTELALFSHLRSMTHHLSISERYENSMLTTNEAVEIHNLRHIVDTDIPLDNDKETNSDDQHSSRASSLVNYYHSSHLTQAGGGVSLSESDRESLLAIEKKCRKLRQKLILAGKSFNREWFTNKIRSRLAQLLIQQRLARNQSTVTDVSSLANTIDLSANNVNCQQNKPFYLKINRITRELINTTADQRISGGGLMPAGIIHSVDRLLADLIKQLSNRESPKLMPNLLYLPYNKDKPYQEELDADQLSAATKMIEFYAIDTLSLYDIVSCLVSILRRIVPNVSLTSKPPSTVASHASTLIDPVSLNSYYCHRVPILPARIYIKIIGLLQSLCTNHGDLCYIIFQSNNMINLSDVLSYRLGFIIGNQSPASSISGSSSAATLSAQNVDRKARQHEQQQHKSHESKSSQAIKKSLILGTQTSDDDCSWQQNNDGRVAQIQSNSKYSNGCTLDLNSAEEGGDENEEVENNEYDLYDRAETYKRSEEVVDDMTAGLCKLLATVTETILSRPLVLLNRLDKTAFDQRSDDFISYMVSVGIVDTESVIMSHIHQQQHHHNNHQQQQQQILPSSGQSNNGNVGTTFANSPSEKYMDSSIAHPGQTGQICAYIPGSTSALPTASGSTLTTAAAAIAHSPSISGPSASATSSSSSTANNKIINFTTSCIQFVTSLVKLVIAKLPEDEAEQAQAAQQDRTQLLATLKMTQLSGVLTLVYDMLVNSFNSLTEQAPDRKLTLALHSLRLINYVAYIDTKLLQSTLTADEMLPLQLRHVCSYLISYLNQTQFKIIEQKQIALAVCEQRSLISSKDDNDLLKNELMNEIILLLGNFAYLNKDNQLLLMSGRQPSIIEQLVALPFDYFARQRLKLVLMPTLISCAYQNDQICALICQEMSLSMLTSFIEDQLLEAQVESKPDERKRHFRSLVEESLTSGKLSSSRWRFERRVAKCKWLSAKKYFEVQQSKAHLNQLSPV